MGAGRQQGVALLGGGVGEGLAHQVVGGREVVADESGAHAELVGDASQGDALQPFVQGDAGGGVQDLRAAFAGGLAGAGGLRS